MPLRERGQKPEVDLSMSGPSAEGRLPDFLIIGEAKCGSTTLWEILSREPRVFFPEEKELHFFSSYREWPAHGRLETTGLAPYQELFAQASPDQLCGEATPNYLFDAGAAERIRRVLPTARLIAIMRDPVQRAWSHYWHQVRRGRETLSFEDALEAEAERLASGDADTQTHFSYFARGRYSDGLQRYAELFGREQICAVFLEDLKRDPQPVVEQVFAHLGLEAPSDPAQWTLAHANRASFPRWPKLDALTRAARRRAERLSPALLKPIQSLGKLTRPLRVYSGAPRMADATAQALRQRYAPSDAELAAWLGRTPPWVDADGASPAAA